MQQSCFNHHWKQLTFIAILPMIIFWPLLVGFLPDFMDVVALHYPMRMAAAAQLRDGVLPLWLPNQFLGTPFAANPQHSIWYPLQFLLYLFPSHVFYGWWIVGHYILGGLGAYAFVYTLTRRKIAGLFAAVTLLLGSVMITRPALLVHLPSCCLFPWLLFCTEKVLSSRSLLPNRWTVCLAGTFAISALSGAPQLTYYFAIALPLYTLLRGASSGRGKLMIALCHGVVAGVLAILLSSIQLVPTLDYLSVSARNPISLERLTQASIGGEQHWRALFGFSGNELEDTDSINAVGPGVLLLVVLALCWRRRLRNLLPLMAVALLGYLLSTSSLTSLYNDYLPGYSRFNAPRRSLILWSLTMPLAAGIALPSLMAWLKYKKLNSFAVYTIIIILAGSNLWLFPRLERKFTDLERLSLPSEYKESIGDSRFMSLDPTLNYSYDSRRDFFGRSLIPPMATLHGLYDPQGYDAMMLARYSMARDYANRGGIRIFPAHTAIYTIPDAPMIDFFNVNYFVGRADLFTPSRFFEGTLDRREALMPKLELVHDHEYYPLYRWKDYRPLAWTPTTLMPMPTPEEAISMIDNQRERYAVATVEEPSLTRFPLAAADVSATRVSPSEWAIDVAPSDTFYRLVVLSSAWEDGWMIRFEDGNLKKTIPVNGFLTGILIPPGVSSAHVVYTPRSFTVGLWLTLLGLVLSSLILIRQFYFSSSESPSIT